MYVGCDGMPARKRVKPCGSYYSCVKSETEGGIKIWAVVLRLRRSLMAFSRGPFWALEKTDGATFRENPFQVSLEILERPVAPFHWDGIRSNLERKSQSGFTFRLQGQGPESISQISRRSKWDFQESRSELGHFSKRSKKPTWKRHKKCILPL
jgi:hypothetical protein